MAFEEQPTSRQRVLDIARRALAPACGGDGAVPDLLAQAVATGEGDRQAVRRAGEAAAPGLEHPLELVLFDTDRIGEYVFESSRPPVIRGASTILETLNREIAGDYEEWTIFSGGGEGLLLVPAGRGEEICADIEARYQRRTAGALGVTTGWLPVAAHDFVAARGGEAKAAGGLRLVSGTQAVLARLRDAVRRTKDGRLPRWEPVPGHRPRCVSCRDREGVENTPVSQYREDERGYLCPPCHVRWEVGKHEIHGTSFEDLVEDFAAALHRRRTGDPTDGDFQPEEGSRAMDLGFLYADGNAMGALFGGLDNLTELRFLSQAVRHLFQQAHGQVIEKLAAAMGAGGEKLPMVSLLSGGDEAIWILPAALALDVADRLPGWLAGAAKEMPGLQDILARKGIAEVTVGTGLVLCDHSYPVRYQHELAKQLQRNAKRAFFYEPADGRPASGLDFSVLTDATPLAEELEEARAVTYETQEPGFLRTCRPYRAADLTALRRRTDRAATGVARSQLYALQQGAGEGERIYLNYLRYQIGRGGEAAKRYCAWLEAEGVDVDDPGAIAEFFVRPVPGRPPGNGEAPRRRGAWITDALELAPYFELLSGLEG